MRAFRLGASVAIAIAMAGAVHAAQRIRPIHPEREDMSEDRRRDLVLGDLKSILTGPASPTTIATKPYASAEKGLCRRDVIRLHYAREQRGNRDSPVRPIGISATSVQYHFLRGEHDGSEVSRQKACEQLAGEKVYWASSRDEDDASFALARLEATVADVRASRRFTIDCTELATDEIKTSCAGTFLFAADRISSLSRCHDREDECYEFISSPYRLKIIRTYSSQIEGGYSTAIEIGYEPIVVV